MQKSHSLTQVLEELKNKGYTHHFFKKNNYILCEDPELNFHTHELEIAEVFREHDKESLLSGSVVYTIESVSLGIKGLLLNHY